MRGLYEKDLRLLLQRKQSMIIFLTVMIFLGISGAATFVISYGTILFGIMTVSTIAYDSHDNGMTFLMTLPVTAKDYVLEKIAFIGTGVTSGWVVSLILAVVMASAKGQLNSIYSELGPMVLIIPLFMTALSIMLPLQLKYGAEGSRVVMLVIAGVIFAIVFAASKLAPQAGEQISAYLDQAALGLVIVATVAICVVILAVIYYVSVKILEKKQF